MKYRFQNQVLVVASAMLVCALVITSATNTRAASFAEPGTVFYGKVVGTGSQQPFLVTEGELTWTIRRSDGTDLALRATLSPLGGGEFSYRLDVPHTALGLDLLADDSSGSIALPVVAQTQSHLGIAINGIPARIAGPSGVIFDVDQARRAATYRLDLEVDLAAVDSDGDGLPDQWEDEHGLNKQDASDANGDLDGDGRTNLAEYLAGSNPALDSSAPTLLSTEVFAYSDGTSGVFLEVDDIDSTPDQLTFTLEALPVQGELRQRNVVDDPDAPDLTLSIGSQFSLQAVRDGRIVYKHGGDDIGYDSFHLRVRDEEPTHASSAGKLDVHLYKPSEGELASSSPDQRGLAYFLARDAQYIAWDLSAAIRPVSVATPSTGLSSEDYQESIERYGLERGQMMAGGTASDDLRGGMANDRLAGGRGDDSLRGGGGADVFSWGDPADGHDSVYDFSPSEGDVLVLSDLFADSTRWVDEHIHLAVDGTDVVIEVGISGDGIDYSDLSIRLVGFSDPDVSLRNLVSSGALIPGDLKLETLVSIEMLAAANENGPVSGLVRVRRDGLVSAPLDVNLVVAGAALNGIDYSLISNLVTIPAGASFADIEIAPFPDSIAEPLETVEISLASGLGYRVDPTTSSARVLIQDLLPQLSLRVVRANAIRDSGQPALVLLQREGVVDRGLFVELEFSGTATRGGDYNAPTFVQLQSGQTSELINIDPLAGGQFPDGVESVVVKIGNDPAYGVGTIAWAELVISPEEENFALWAARNFGTAEDQLDDLAALDPGSHGLSVLERYAFRLDPTNPWSDKSRLPAVSIREDNILHFEYYRAAGVNDLVFELETSSDLSGWLPNDGSFERYPAPWSAGQPGRTVYRSTAPVDPSDTIYLRVRPRRQQP